MLLKMPRKTLEKLRTRIYILQVSQDTLPLKQFRKGQRTTEGFLKFYFWKYHININVIGFCKMEFQGWNKFWIFKLFWARFKDSQKLIFENIIFRSIQGFSWIGSSILKSILNIDLFEVSSGVPKIWFLKLLSLH